VDSAQAIVMYAIFAAMAFERHAPMPWRASRYRKAHETRKPDARRRTLSGVRRSLKL